MSDTTDAAALRELATTVVTAYVSNHHLPAANVPSLVITVYGALAVLATGTPSPAASTEVAPLTPAEIRKSIRPGELVSFLDGRAYKTLGRHLRAYGLTPESYRTKFGLPVDYPMVSPNYSVRRSDLAKAHRFGRVDA
jgi:predicted transcriptional regulator